MDLLKGLSLFSGIGGIDLALKKWVRPIAYCEIEPYCQSVLLQRMQEGNLSKAPIWPDIRTFPSNEIIGKCDIIYGGFPCQDISVAGVGKGLDGKRSGLFFEMLRLAEQIKPKFIFLENVPAITTRGGLRVVKEIAKMGYDTRWGIISAKTIGAKHKRDRWFMLSYSKSERLQKIRQSGGSKKIESVFKIDFEYEKFYKEPSHKLELAGMAYDVSHRMERIKSLGNAVVPDQVLFAFELLMGIQRK